MDPQQMEVDEPAQPMQASTRPTPKQSVSEVVRIPPDFTKLKMLGKGDVGKVYLVREKSSNKLYAMKVMRKSDLLAREKGHRAVIEQGIISTLRHPFIIQLFYSFQTETHLYLCMQFCAGGEFFRFLSKQPGKRLDETSTRFYVAEVVCALEYLHLMGYIYRDLKPENLLLHASGHLMLADFDLSKPGETLQEPRAINSKSPFGGSSSNQSRFIDTKSVLNKTRATSFVGTEEYLAPEIIRGKPYTSMVDWWTLGVLTYEMMHGASPFKGATSGKTYRRILKDSIVFPLEISVDAKHFIRRLLNKNPEKRLGSKIGAAEVKSSNFFRGTRWALLRHQKPPYEPPLQNRYDLSCFSNRYDATEKQNSELIDGIEWEDISELVKNDPLALQKTPDVFAMPDTRQALSTPDKLNRKVNTPPPVRPGQQGILPRGLSKVKKLFHPVTGKGEEDPQPQRSGDQDSESNSRKSDPFRDFGTYTAS